jgi:probable F420-dependent oxidoreductase
MSEENVWRDRVGRFGVWAGARRLNAEIAQAADRVGFGTLWIGGVPSGDLRFVEGLLDATARIVIATGVVNIWHADASEVAASYHRIAGRHPGRFLLGVGAGHPESAGAAARRPFGALVDYLDVLDARGVPRDDIVLAALGPRVLRLAGDRTAGAHPYLITPEHTKLARDVLGTRPLLAPEQRVVLEKDAARARALGGKTVARPYLALANYRNSLLRLGYPEDELDDGGSDRLIDDLVVYGGDEIIAARLRAHLDAGADHVAVQPVTGPDGNPADDLARLAHILGLGGVS